MSHRDKKEKVCIKTRKVFDWVTRQVDLPVISKSDDNLKDFFKCDGSLIDDICKFLDQHNDPKDFTVVCKIDEDSIICQEIVQPDGRLNVTVTLPNGDKVTLQKVKVLVKGLADIAILDENDRVICKSKRPITFVTAQTFILCAPDGTDVECEVTFSECDASLICTNDFQQLDVSITLCLDVQVEADVKLEVEAKICKPREEDIQAIDICPDREFPPQCPEVFPAR